MTLATCQELWIAARSSHRFGRAWLPVGATPAVFVCVIHGLGEHSARYADLAERMAMEGFGTLAIDLFGHGKSPGWRGCVDSFDDLIEDVKVSIKWIADHYPEAKIILYGHSMGGNLALNYALRGAQRPSAVIASGSFLRPAKPPSKLFLSIVSLIAKFLPHYRLNTHIRPELLTRDAQQLEAYRRDPLVHRLLSLRLGGAVLESGQWAIDHAAELSIPTLVIHGADDELTCPAASEQFARNSNSYCTLKILPGLLHDVHREVQREEVYRYIIDWLGRSLSQVR